MIDQERCLDCQKLHRDCKCEEVTDKMKNSYPIEMKINIWDFVDINKLNEHTDEFLGEVADNLQYTIEQADSNGTMILSVDCDK